MFKFRIQKGKKKIHKNTHIYRAYSHYNILYQQKHSGRHPCLFLEVQHCTGDLIIFVLKGTLIRSTIVLITCMNLPVKTELGKCAGKKERARVKTLHSQFFQEECILLQLLGNSLALTVYATFTYQTEGSPHMVKLCSQSGIS